MTVKALILRTAGTNCDEETRFAFQQAGADAEKLHVNLLRDNPDLLGDYDILTIPGGFSYGDDLGAGTVLANELLTRLRDALERFVDDGKIVIGICNGFQVLVKTGLLPGFNRWKQEATLTLNDSGKFEDRWVYLKAPRSRSVLIEDGESFYIPVAHAEGKFVPQNDDTLRALHENGQIVFQYAAPDDHPLEYPWNPNGSIDNIAGVCDVTGRILGMMPHPERYCLPIQHPRWTREGFADQADGARIFQRAIDFMACR